MINSLDPTVLTLVSRRLRNIGIAFFVVLVLGIFAAVAYADAPKLPNEQTILLTPSESDADVMLGTPILVDGLPKFKVVACFSQNPFEMGMDKKLTTKARCLFVGEKGAFTAQVNIYPLPKEV